MNFLALIPGVGPFLATVVSYWKLILAGLLALTLAVFIWSWHARGVAIGVLEMNVATLQADLVVAHQTAQLAQDAQDALVVRLAARQAAATTFNTLSQEALHAPSKSDAPLAPVLRDALSGLGKLRQPASRP